MEREAFESELLETLSRIALAMEKIAEAKTLEKDASKRTHFPWGQMSVRVRTAIRERLYEYPTAASFPCSCEELIQIGRTEIKRWKNLGETSITQIDNKMLELGFDDWMKS